MTLVAVMDEKGKSHINAKDRVLTKGDSLVVVTVRSLRFAVFCVAALVVLSACKKNASVRTSGIVVVHPTFGTPMWTTRLVVVLACDASDARVVSALDAVHARVDRTMMERLLAVSIDAPSDPLDLSPLLEARSKLQAERCVEAVSLDTVHGDTANAPVGHLSRPVVPRCDWASHRVEETYGAHAVVFRSNANCLSERFTVNARDFFVVQITLEPNEHVVAIVDDAGVYPLRDDAASPANAPKLTGRMHWSQQTRQGRYWVEKFVGQHTGTPFAQTSPLDAWRFENAATFKQLQDARMSCFERTVKFDPSTKGAVINLFIDVGVDGRVQRVETKWTVAMGSDLARAASAGCLREAAQTLSFIATPGDGDIWSVVEVYSVN